eukprot:TRINITY_DN489_c0_g1_i4.p1 TRINITY_DN489_c0_g1~~TRINITY_DN489_c0_g1_i4.p1  ORF type:complete len:245 (-),score=34.25 TRINITY_DN489_c0_g1_i4:70-804(-)
MATGMSTIFIQWLEGKTRTCYFPTGTFNETTISELKLQIKTGFEPDEQRLIFVSKELKTIMNGREMTFRDYGLSDKSYIMLVVRLTGGGGPGFTPLRFADVSSEASFKDIKLTSDGPDWLTLAPGINFEGTCRGRFCQAENRTVVIQRGFYDSTGGTCMLNYEIIQLECPMCKQTLDKDEINGVGVYKAKLEVKSKAREDIEVVVNIEARDKYLYAGCMDDNDKVDYEYIILKIKRFPWYSFLF